MRLYAVALITWAAIITASSESNNNPNLKEKAVDYTEFRDLPAKQIVQPYVTGIEARSSRQTGTEDHSDDVANAGLSRSAASVGEERGSNDDSTTDPFSPELIYATPLAETIDEHLFRRPSSESAYTISEDVLLVENAGRFGQRVRQDYPSDKTIVTTTIDSTDGRKDDEYVSFRKSFSSTVSPLEDGDSHKRPFVSTTGEPFVLALKKESSLTDDSLSDDFEVIKSFTKNSNKSFDTGDATENLPLSKTDIVSNLENDVVPENLPRPQARSSRAHNGTKDEITKKSVESTKKSESITRTSTSVEISPSLQTGKFSGPIVVPDLVPDRETQEMVLDYLDDNDAAAAFTSVGNTEIALETNAESTKAAASNGVAMSSIMLNPLQVGITLVNADETAWMDDSEQSAAMDTTDYLQDDLQRLATVDKEFVENDRNQSYADYEDKNFHSIEKERSAEVVTQKAPDSSVEIQKSIELYHTAPVHEIHYPPEYIHQTSNLGVIETNNIGNSQRPKQPYSQNEQSESRSNYDIYQGNNQVEKSITKAYASTFSQNQFNRHEYNTVVDDVGKPVASTVVAEYSNTQEQPSRYEMAELRPFKYNNVQPVLLVPNQFDDTLYDQSNVRHTFNDNDNDNVVLPHAKSTASSTRSQEITNELVKPYVPSTYREQQPQSNQPIDHQHPFRSSEMRRPEAPPHLLLRIIPNGSTADGSFVVPIPRPYPIEKIIEKTVHVPHPIEIEKVIEKKVPFPVERLVEKQVQVPVAVPVPQPYPVQVQVPIDRVVEKQIRVPHIYPIHVERTIEKKIPYAVQRLLVQPPPSYPPPLHVRLPAVYSTHVPVHISAPIEQTTEMSSYRVDVEKPPSNSGSVETKFINKYHQKVLREPISVGGFAFEPQPQSEANASQLYSVPYGRPLAYEYYNVDVGKSYAPAAHLSNVRLMILPKKFGSRVILGQHAIAPSYARPASLTRQVVYNLVEKDKPIKDEYVGPAPPRKTSQNKAFSHVKSSQFSTSATQSLAAVLRRSRQPETQYPGSFRQSKMEYGFKPPMVPSVQYDEKTASKVEN